MIRIVCSAMILTIALAPSALRAQTHYAGRPYCHRPCGSGRPDCAPDTDGTGRTLLASEAGHASAGRARGSDGTFRTFRTGRAFRAGRADGARVFRIGGRARLGDRPWRAAPRYSIE